MLRQGTFPDVIRWLLEWMHDKHNLQVDAHIDDRVHPQCPQVRQLLFEASRELLFNVVKHSGVRQAQLELTQDDADQLRLVIADSGRGFDPASARPIGDVSAACGLFTIRERLNLVGGSVQIDSAPGRGTRATLLAPIRAADIAPRQIEQPLPAQAAAPPRPAAATKGKIRVLLADDHAMVRRGLAQLLEDNGQIEVVGQASDGQEALELARRLQPDVVTMDVSMPRLSGMEATRLLHAEMPEVQVIGLSMYAESSVAEAMKAAGAVNYLAKSAPPESLVDAILACRPR